MFRVLIPNYEFVENWSEDQLNDFLATPSGIPYEIMAIVRKVFSDVNTKRKFVYFDNPNLKELDQDERAVTYDLSIDEAMDYHINYALDFLEKYPQFKPMIKGVEEV